MLASKRFASQLFALALVLLHFGPAIGPASTHKYTDGEDVQLYANKVGPFHNPSETYQYYDLPVCPPSQGREYVGEDFGEVLEGDRLVSTPFKLPFKANITEEKLCTKKLSPKDVQRFRTAVANNYYFQLYYDDLPLWGFFGKVEKFLAPRREEYKYYLFTHFHFHIGYNNDRVIEINAQVDPLKAIDITSDEDVEATFTYSATWRPTSIPFERRLEKYSRHSFLPQHLEVHWISILNSCITVLLLTGFLATILMRVLKNDFTRYSYEDDVEEQEETGWKYIRGDVFRLPRNTNLLCAIIGVGFQLFWLTLSIFSLALVGFFYPFNRGALLSALVILYSFTGSIAGYMSGKKYKQFGGNDWKRNFILTTLLFSGPMVIAFSFLNSVAIAYRSTMALPFGTICIIVLIWLLVTLPLTMMGAVMGKNSRSEFNPPCRVNKHPRQIPPLPWYRKTFAQMLMAGFLPFSAIYVELYYIFASVWGQRIYTIYSILFIVFMILIIVTSFITISLTYFQLAAEDYRWWWRSILCGGSTALFIYGYAIYYYWERSQMAGFMQTSFFFGYMAMVCLAFFLMLGAIGFQSSFVFVNHIYKVIKSD